MVPLFRRNPVGELQPRQPRIKPALRHQRIMGALGHHAPGLQHQDPVGLFHRCQPMGHDQRRAPSAQPLDGQLYSPLAFSISKVSRVKSFPFSSSVPIDIKPTRGFA